MTHYDPRCVGSCVIASEIIHALVYEGVMLGYDEIVDIAKYYDERIVLFVDMAHQDDLEALDLDDEASMGYTLKTLGAALWSYWHANSYREGISKIILSGGDADTTSAVAGAILGAKFGLEQIPEVWRNGLIYKAELCSKVSLLSKVVQN